MPQLSAGQRNLMRSPYRNTEGSGGLRWAFGSGGRPVRGGRHWCHQGGRRWRDGRNDASSGRGSRQVCRVRMRRLGPVCLRLSEHDGSGRPGHATSNVWTIGEAALRAIPVAGGAGGACDPACAGHGHSGDRSAGRAVGVDDLAGSDALRLTGATRRRAAAAWIIGRLSRNGMPNGPRGVRSLRSWRATRRCGRMCRTGWPAWSSRQVGLRLPGQQPAADGGAWRGSPLEERTCAGRARRRGGARQHRANDHQLARAASAVLDLGSGGGDVAACTAEDRHRRGGLFL